MTKISFNAVRVFENNKASKMFYSISECLKGSDKKNFTAQVKDLFEKKTVSEDGQFSVFKVTEDELKSLAVKFI